MKPFIGLLFALMLGQTLMAQKVSYNAGVLQVDGIFKGGNSAQTCLVSTNKDGITQKAAIPSGDMVYGKLYVRSEGMDRNAVVLKSIAKWLVDKWYL